MIILKSINFKPKESQSPVIFPFNLPIIQSLGKIEFTSSVTFFAGENGSGKSTLLEAIACAAGSITVGSESVNTDTSLASIREFSKHLQLSWQKRTRRGFFLRAEDFFGYAKGLNQTQQELGSDLNSVDHEYIGRSQEAINLAKGVYSGQIHEIKRRYGNGLDSGSHGENYLTLFQSRFVPNGLYLLDEPEAPLSPMRQLAFLALLKGMVAQDAQFIIASHSPIIMAFPGASILSFDSSQIHRIDYNSLEHVSFTRSFLNNPNAYLNHL